MKKIFLAAATFAVLGFAGCAKDNGEIGNNNNGVVEGKGDAKLSLSIKMPAASKTRLADGADLTANADESNVLNVSVYIFETNGTPASVGGYTAFADLTKFDGTTIPGTYTLLPANEIETIAGAKRIYVGVNIPATATALVNPASETAFLAAVDAVTAMSVVDAGGDATKSAFTMFSEVAVPTLVKDPVGDEHTTIENKIAFPVKRVVAKIVGSADDSVTNAGDADTDEFIEFTNKWDTATAPEAPLTLVYEVSGFRVFNQNIKSYVAPNYWATSTLAKTWPGVAATPANVLDSDDFSDFADDAVVTPADIKALPADAALNAMKGFYVGENYPVDANGQASAINNNTTYVMVVTTATADMYAEWVDTDDDDATQATNPTDGYVKWTAMPAGTTYGGGVDDIYTVKGTDGNVYITNTLERASALAYGKGGIVPTDPIAAPADNDVIFKYTEGYVHFQTYIGREELNDYSVLRNQFINVIVNGIFNGNYKFPGSPGDPANPDQPTDPTGTDPENPDPIDPTDPVDGAKAYLDVEVTPMPWTYRTNETILQ
jgi:hypothetical protein